MKIIKKIKRQFNDSYTDNTLSKLSHALKKWSRCFVFVGPVNCGMNVLKHRTTVSNMSDNVSASHGMRVGRNFWRRSCNTAFWTIAYTVSQQLSLLSGVESASKKIVHWSDFCSDLGTIFVTTFNAPGLVMMLPRVDNPLSIRMANRTLCDCSHK